MLVVQKVQISLPSRMFHSIVHTLLIGVLIDTVFSVDISRMMIGVQDEVCLKYTA
jgi:hypothetical protein